MSRTDHELAKYHNEVSPGIGSSDDRRTIALGIRVPSPYAQSQPPPKQVRALLPDSRSSIYAHATRIWFPVAIYAVLHDQYVVRIEPRHFTEYHPLVWGVTSPALQAAVLAFFASIGPGLMLGLGCVVAGWIGNRPRIPDRFVMRGVLTVIVCAEIACLLSGLWVFKSGQPLCLP